MTPEADSEAEWEPWPVRYYWAQRRDWCRVCSTEISIGDSIARIGPYPNWVHEEHAEAIVTWRRWNSRLPGAPPTVVRLLKGSLRVFLPYPGHDPDIDVKLLRKAVKYGAKQHEDTRGDIRPVWAGEWWEVSRAHYVYIIAGLAKTFGRCDVEEHYNLAETCYKSCQDAGGDECTCSCCHANHGISRKAPDKSYEDPRSKWKLVGDGPKLVSEQEMVVRYSSIWEPDDTMEEE